MITCLVKY